MHLFTVTAGAAQPVAATTLAAGGFTERADLQEWIIAHPRVLGDDLLILTAEFDRWAAADGVTAKDRLDILALEPSGRLVVAELKRDDHRDVHLQAITYAALVSTFTPDTLAEAHAEFRSRRGVHTTVDEAKDILSNHLVDEWDPELLRRPRIVLVAARFSRTVTHCAVWLSEVGLDLTLVRVSAWQLTAGGTMVGFDQLYPTTAVEEITLAPARQESRAATARAAERSRAASAVSRLVASGALGDGAELELTPSTHTSAAERAAIAAWVAKEPARGRATWRNDNGAPIIWGADQRPWRATTLARHILREAGLADHAVRGPAWWTVTDTGIDLAATADGLEGQVPFDWSPLHHILDRIPPTRWTTFGDLAAVVGTAPQPLGNHILRCIDCTNGYRVLNASGKIPGGFRWNDPSRTEDPQEILAAEGVTFTDGRADPAARMAPDELRGLAQRNDG